MGFYSPVKNEMMVISEVELEAIMLNKVIQQNYPIFLKYGIDNTKGHESKHSLWTL